MRPRGSPWSRGRTLCSPASAHQPPPRALREWISSAPPVVYVLPVAFYALAARAGRGRPRRCGLSRMPRPVTRSSIAAVRHRQGAAPVPRGGNAETDEPGPDQDQPVPRDPRRRRCAARWLHAPRSSRQRRGSPGDRGVSARALAPSRSRCASSVQINLDWAVEWATDVDYADRYALIATTGPDQTIVGHGAYIRIDESSGRSGVHDLRRLAGSRDRHDPAAPPRCGRRRTRHLRVPRLRAAREPAHAGGVPRKRLLVEAAHQG